MLVGRENVLALVDVVVQAEDAAGEEECLADVDEQPIGHVLNGEYLKGYHHHAGQYQQHGAGVLYLLGRGHRASCLSSSACMLCRLLRQLPAAVSVRNAQW